MIEIRLPQVMESMHEGTILEWAKASGDSVREGEFLAEIEADKATFEIESPSSGTVQILVEEGSTISVGTVIATVAADEGGD